MADSLAPAAVLDAGTPIVAKQSAASSGADLAGGPAASLALSVALISIAGCVDAIGYLRLSHLFMSFMSGNSTQLAVALVRGDLGAAERAGSVVALFVLGVFVGRMICRAAGRYHRRANLGLEALLLAAAAVLSPGEFAHVAPMVVAMGLQNAVFYKAADMTTSRTYVTGTLVSLGEKLAEATSGSAFGWVRPALMWSGMVIGAAFGAFSFGETGLRALFYPAAAAAALGLLLIRAERRSPVA